MLTQKFNTIFDSELEHCIELLLRDKHNLIEKQNMEFTLEKVKDFYGRPVYDYWSNRYQRLNEDRKYDK
jgi:hypothetical protein